MDWIDAIKVLNKIRLINENYIYMNIQTKVYILYYIFDNSYDI